MEKKGIFRLWAQSNGRWGISGAGWINWLKFKQGMGMRKNETLLDPTFRRQPLPEFEFASKD